jgi:hypothetical protein
MALEVEFGFESPDRLAARIDRMTFRELVEYVARQRDAA